MTTGFIVASEKFPIIDKDPDAVLDYYVDWVDWLDAGDSISSHTVVGSGITVDSTAIVDTTKVQAFLSSGILGTQPTAIYQIVTAQGRTVERTLQFNIVQR